MVSQEAIRPFRSRILHGKQTFGEKIRTSRKGKAGIGAVAAVIITLIAVLLIIGAAYYAGFIPTPPSQQTTPPPTVSTASQTGAYAGSLITQVGGQDYFSASQTYTPGTNFNVIWYDNPTGSYWNNLGQNAQTISVKPTDNGIIYAYVTIPSGQNLYVQQYRTLAQGAPYVQGWSYVSIANNGVNAFLFKINLNGPPPLPPGNGGTNPTLSFYPIFFNQATLSLNTLSAINSLGSNPNTQFLQWVGTFPAGTPNVGTKISEVQITVNSSNAAALTMNSVNIPATNSSAKYAGVVAGSSFTQQQGSSSFIYTLPIASNTLDLGTAESLLYAQNSLDSFAFTTSVTTDFGAASGVNCLNVQITIYVVSAQDTLSTLTQSVNLASGSVC